MQRRSRMTIGAVLVLVLFAGMWWVGSFEAHRLPSAAVPHAALPQEDALKLEATRSVRAGGEGPTEGGPRSATWPMLRPAEAKRPFTQVDGTRPAALRTASSESSNSSLTADAGHRRFALDRNGVRDAMKAALPEVRECYEAWLTYQPELSGRLALRFTIDTDDGVEGRVVEVSVGGDAGTGNPAFEGCVLSVVSDLSFEPPLNGKLNVTYPLAFVAPPKTSPEVQAQLGVLCQRIRTEALRPEHAKVSPDDRLTSVLLSLMHQTPSLTPYFEALLPADVPPIQRNETFTRGISTALGAPWSCPEFEALWDGQPVPR